MGTRFKEFPQTPRGRGFSLHWFILYLRTMLMLELVEVVRGRLIGPKTWDRIVLIYGTQFFTICVCSRTVWVSNGVIHAMNCVVVCIRPEMAEKYGFTK